MEGMLPACVAFAVRTSRGAGIGKAGEGKA
jgi:hypothetical protein